MSGEKTPANLAMTDGFPLQPGNQVLNMLFEHMLNGVACIQVIFDGNRPVDWLYLYSNPAFHAQTGLGAVVGYRGSELHSQLEVVDRSVLDSLGRVARSGKPERFETYLAAIHQWHSLSVFSPVREYCIVVFDNISARKKAEANLRQALLEALHYREQVQVLSMLYATLSGVNSAIVHCESETELFESICTAATTRGGFQLAWAGRADWDAGRVEIIAIQGMEWSEAVRERVRGMRLRDWTEPNPGPVVEALRSGNIQFRNDIQNDPLTPKEWLAAHGGPRFASYVAIPVMRAGRTCAALGLMSVHPNFITAETQALAEEIGRDISFALNNFERERERQVVARKLADSDRRLRLSLDFAGVGIKEINLRTRQVFLDGTAARILGFGNEPQVMSLESYLERAAPMTTPEMRERYVQDLLGPDSQGYTSERPIVLPDGSLRWVRSRGGVVVRRPESGDDPIALSVMVDVTESHAQLERERLAMEMFANSREPIAITDADKRFVMVNDAFVRMSGYTREEILGGKLELLRSSRHTDEFYSQIDESLQRDSHWQGEMWLESGSGRVFPALVRVSVVRNKAGEITHCVEQCTDISQQKEFEERITYLAYRDALTDLPNRTLLRDRIEQALVLAQREETSLALLFIDLDHFKNINDTLGHAVGDQLLREVAWRLSLAVREMDTVGRLGGDEFLILLQDADPAAARIVAEKILDAVPRPCRVDGHELSATPSIGISVYPRDGKTFDELLKAADMAMYRAKDEGRNTCRFFVPEMDAAVSRRVMLESGLRRALDGKGLELYYQPQYGIDGRTLIGAEALIRWCEPTQGFISPGAFIPVAEESSLIEAIGAWVLDEACRQARAWRDMGHAGLRISVNFSARQFAAKAVVDDFDRVLARHGLSGEALEVEITESVLVDLGYAIGVLRSLRERGIHVAVDDFGTGYSSLAYLKRYPINRLKIDQSFVRELGADADDRAIATAVVTLGHSLGMKVIAEGVETAQQLQVLRDLGCDEVQGFHLGRPMPATEFTALLATSFTAAV